MNRVPDRLAQLTGAEVRLLQTVARVAVLLALRRAILPIVRHHTADVPARYWWRKAVTCTVGALALFLVAGLWFEAFAKAPDIDLAYPTTRFFTNTVEGKPALGPEAPS